MHLNSGMVFPYSIPGRDILILDALWFAPMGHPGICGIVVTENGVGERKIFAGVFDSFSDPHRDAIRIAEMGGKISGEDLERLLETWRTGR